VQGRDARGAAASHVVRRHPLLHAVHAAHVLGSPGHWRMLPTHANGHPAVAAYTRTSDDSYQPYGIVVLDTRQHGISRITAFGDPVLIAAFGLPMQLPAP
jgi:RNA polymerase sigma-70 factor, ECF subfamily